MLWQKTIGGKEDDAGLCVRQTKDGGFAMAGETQSTVYENSKIFLVITDKNGR